MMVGIFRYLLWTDGCPSWLSTINLPSPYLTILTFNLLSSLHKSTLLLHLQYDLAYAHEEDNGIPCSGFPDGLT